MTNQICGDSSTVEQLPFQAEEGGAIPTSPLQFSFHVIKAKQACELNAQWHSRFPYIHWSNVVRNKRSICYVASFNNEHWAVAIWSSPIAGNRLKDGWLLLELRRMAIKDGAPKNTASRMLSWMRKDIEKRFPEIIKLISYQDVDVHEGTIYKASGWIAHNPAKFTDWSTSTRKRSKAQSTAAKVRWEFELKRKMGEV